MNDAAVCGSVFAGAAGDGGAGGSTAEHHRLSLPPQREHIRRRGERLHLPEGAVFTAKPLKMMFPLKLDAEKSLFSLLRGEKKTL